MPFSTFIPLVSLALFATDAIATGLFVSSYNGSIFSLTLTLNYYQGLYKLTHQFTDNGCAPNATSLTLDEHNRLLYCVGEGTASVNGSLSSYSISANGFLNQQHKVKTIGGPVNAALYGNPNTTHGVGIANYGEGAISTFSTNGSGVLTTMQNITFSLSQPGPLKESQAAPHPHQTFVDPTGRYILVPDLGADLMRVFSWDSAHGLLTAHEALQVKKGSGPRHGTFWRPSGGGGSTYLYVVSELDASLTGFEVFYLEGGGLDFKEIYRGGTVGNESTHQGIAPAEIVVAPGNAHLVVSNRNDSSFRMPNTVPRNATPMVSDSIASYYLPSPDSGPNNTKVNPVSPDARKQAIDGILHDLQFLKPSKEDNKLPKHRRLPPFPNLPNSIPINATSVADIAPRQEEPKVDAASILAGVPQPNNVGIPEFSELAPSWGRTPRSIAINKLGNLVAVANQDDGRLAILSRTPPQAGSRSSGLEAGLIGSALVTMEGLGQITCVVWDED